MIGDDVPSFSPLVLTQIRQGGLNIFHHKNDYLYFNISHLQKTPP